MSAVPGQSGANETGSGTLPPAEAVAALRPLQRLAQSRARLRAVLAPPVAPAADESDSGPSWEQRLRAIPGVAFAVDVVQAWWQHHPLRAATTVAREVSRAALRPVAGRHPFALVAVAVGIGAALAWARPWRWALKSALFAGLVPQFASRVASALPIEEWVNVIGSLFTRASPPTPTEPAPGARQDDSAPIATPPAASAAAPAAAHDASAATASATAREPAHAH